MSNAEWLTVITLGLSILGGVGRAIWMLSALTSTVTRIDVRLAEAEVDAEQHAAACDPDRAKINWRLAVLEQRWAELLR